MVHRIHLLVALMLVAQAAGATTITVRKDGTGDYSVLQQGLDAAASGDTVLIGPGEYTESSMVRLDGYGWDVETFGLITAADLTVIGSGMGSTIIGPSTYQGINGTYSPKCLVRDLGTGTLHISDLTLRNCYEGVYINGVLQMGSCQIIDNQTGVLWGYIGTGGWVRDTRIEAVTPILSAKSVTIVSGGGSGIQIENCYFGNQSMIQSVNGTVWSNCMLSGLQLNSGARVYINGCAPARSDFYVEMSLGSDTYCEIRDSKLHSPDSFSSLYIDYWAPGGRFVVESTRLEGGGHGVLFAGQRAGGCSIHNCDLVKGSGPMVECAVSTVPVTHDFTNNYWGTADEATIQSWIIDSNDNPNNHATVLYSPFAGQSVPGETTTWGSVKALFR